MIVALKNFDHSCKHNRRKEFKREINVLSSIQHANLVRIFGFNCDLNETYIVEELMENGSLHDYARNDSYSINESASATRLLKLMGDVVDGMIYLHENSIMHYDLKSRNILLSKNFTVAKINNFNLRNIYYATDTPNGPTLRYAAPEVVNSDDHDYASDVWGFGCVVVECITKDEPFKKLDNGQLITVLNNDRVQRLDTMYDIDKNTCPAIFLDLIENCIQRRKEERSTFSELREIINNDSREATRNDELDELRKSTERIENEIKQFKEKNAEKLSDLETSLNNLSLNVQRQQPQATGAIQYIINVFKGSKVPEGVVATGEKYTSRGSANNREIYLGPRGGKMLQSPSGKMRYIYN